MLTTVDDQTQHYLAHWIKSVPFARNQQHVVAVSYRAPIGSSVEGPYVSYAFTGGNWKGKVDRSILEVTSHIKGDRLAGLPPKPTRVSNGTWIYERTNWQAEETIEVFLKRARRSQ